MNHCVFCEIAKEQAAASVIYRDDTCLAFLDIQPVNPGHLLVIPIEHAANLAELDPKSGGHLFEVAQRLAASLRNSSVRCEGVNIFLAGGEAAGQEVFHHHMHIIPRFTGDGFALTFAESYWDLPDRQELDKIAQAIRDG